MDPKLENILMKRFNPFEKDKDPGPEQEGGRFAPYQGTTPDTNQTPEMYSKMIFLDKGYEEEYNALPESTKALHAALVAESMRRAEAKIRNEMAERICAKMNCKPDSDPI